MTTQNILVDSKKARIEEVEYYQVNINNYKMAIEIIDSKNDPDLIDFKAQLEELLRTSLIEQKKAQIMLDVISAQIKE